MQEVMTETHCPLINDLKWINPLPTPAGSYDESLFFFL